MREHCYRGYQMLKKIPFLSEASDIVYAHQEKFDGTRLSARTQRRTKFHWGAHLLGRRYPGRNHLRPPLPARAIDCRRPARRSRNGLAASLIPTSFASFFPCRKISGGICASRSTRRATASPILPPANPKDKSLWWAHPLPRTLSAEPFSTSPQCASYPAAHRAESPSAPSFPPPAARRRRAIAVPWQPPPAPQFPLQLPPRSRCPLLRPPMTAPPAPPSAPRSAAFSIFSPVCRSC